MLSELCKVDATARNYRALNFEVDREIEWAAQMYCASPGFWIQNWQPSIQGMKRVMDRLRGARDSDDQLLLVAEVAPDALIGFHWLVIEQVEPRTARYSGYRHDDIAFLRARRVSLCVEEKWWNRGIATELMTMGERWARSKGALRITASVDFNNTRMFNLNLKRGFHAGVVEMSKDLTALE